MRQAHNPGQQTGRLSASLEAVKLTSIYSDSGSELPNFFERRVSVSVIDTAFRLDKVDPAALREESEMFDGQVLHTTVIEQGKQIEDRSEMGASQYETVEFGIKNMGLLAVLNHISDPRAETAYLGLTARKEDKVEVKVTGGSFIVYADQEHRIRKVVVGRYTMEYADYRSVEGVLLPFIERVFVKGHLMYELVFTGIDINPEFPADHFSRK
jgi:hypothetical protein